ncbi:hypothetical protein [Marinicella sp. W31]|uniref:hypothetical protein n=1 Tax=Marinicella sp. W31 TaxID=3023713 RepID=UPI00375771D0
MKKTNATSFTLLFLFIAQFTIAADDFDIDPSYFSSNSARTAHTHSPEFSGINLKTKGFAVDVHGVIIDNVLQPYVTYSHQLDDFDNRLVIGQNPEENPRPRGLAWSADLRTLYGLSREDNPSLISIDPSNGVSTQIAPTSGQGNDVSLQGIAIDQDNRCFIIATDNNNHNTISTLYECDLATGQLSFIGSQPLAPDLHDITATCDGSLYGINSFSGNLYSLSKLDGSAQLVGPLGLESSVRLFTLTYDRINDTLYQYVLRDNGFQTALAIVDKNTGTATYVAGGFNFGSFVGSVESICDDLIFSNGFEG